MTTMRVVGECFFWYRLTRVFPDKFHRAVKRLCVSESALKITVSALTLKVGQPKGIYDLSGIKPVPVIFKGSLVVDLDHGRSQNFWLGGSCVRCCANVPRHEAPAIGAPKLTEFFSHKWLVWCVEPFQGRNYRGVLDVKTCCMPKISVFCTPPCKNWGGRTTYATYVTSSPFYLLGEDLSILALYFRCAFIFITYSFSPQFTFTEQHESGIIHPVLAWIISVGAQLSLGARHFARKWKCMYEKINRMCC